MKITLKDRVGEVSIDGSDVLKKISPLSEALYAFIIVKQFMDSFGILAPSVTQSELMKQAVHPGYKWRKNKTRFVEFTKCTQISTGGPRRIKLTTRHTSKVREMFKMSFLKCRNGCSLQSGDPLLSDNSGSACVFQHLFYLSQTISP